MMWLKSCPRCQTGVIVMDRDAVGRYIQYLHCGYMRDFEDKIRGKAATGRLSGSGPTPERTLSATG